MSLPWKDLATLAPVPGGDETFDGNVKKLQMADADGFIWFVKIYNPRTQPRDACYECLGQLTAQDCQIPTAETAMATPQPGSPPHILCSRDFLKPGERVVTLRSWGFEASTPSPWVQWVRSTWGEVGDAWLCRVLTLDTILNNGGRHLGNLGAIADAIGTPLRPAPLFDTVAFDNTRLFEAALHSKARWLNPGTLLGSPYETLAHIHAHWPRSQYIPPLLQAAEALRRRISQFSAAGLLNLQEVEFMLQLIAQTLDAAQSPSFPTPNETGL